MDTPTRIQNVYTKQRVEYRSHTHAALDKYGVYTLVDQNGTPREVVYPYPHFQKHRKLDEKTFYASGDTKRSELFGQDKLAAVVQMQLLLLKEKKIVSQYMKSSDASTLLFRLGVLALRIRTFQHNLITLTASRKCTSPSTTTKQDNGQQQV